MNLKQEKNRIQSATGENGKTVKLRASVKNFGKNLVHRETHRKQKYLVCFGLRIPYTTHVEDGKFKRKKYINLLGVEFCYKTFPLRDMEPENPNTKFVYEPNSQIMAYLMEDRLTPDIQRIHCEQKAYKQLGYFPDLRNPRTLNEKMIWLALHYRNPEMAIAVDKATAKGWISARVGCEFVVPLIGVYTDVNDIDFHSLPNRFVAKLNDGWGADKVMIVRNKANLNIDRAKAVLSSWLYPWKNYYYQNLCITDQKMEKPKIVIEEYMEADDNSGILTDFKIHCCNGEPRFALVVSNRGTKEQTRTFVDMRWNVMPVRYVGYPIANPVASPQNLETMLMLARVLSKGFPLVRVDFYESGGRVYVGEMTFLPGLFLPVSSKEWDLKLGNYLDLSDLLEQTN